MGVPNKRDKQRASKKDFPGEATGRPKLEMPVGAGRCTRVLAGLMRNVGRESDSA